MTHAPTLSINESGVSERPVKLRLPFQYGRTGA